MANADQHGGFDDDGERMNEDADEIAAAYYTIDDGNIVLIHTEVPFEHAGEGFGKELAAGVFSLLRANRQKAILKCAFMGGYVARHPENLDLVAG